MNLQTKYLNKLKRENTLADFYTDRFEESDFGFVIGFNDEFLVIEKYDDKHNYDGISVLFRSNITRIRWEGNELDCTTRLIDKSKRLVDKVRIDLTSINTILESIFKFYNHITVHIQDIDNTVCFIGQIKEIDQSNIVIHEFGTKTSLDRKFILLSINDITRIDAGGQYENGLQKLFLK